MPLITSTDIYWLWYSLVQRRYKIALQSFSLELSIEHSFQVPSLTSITLNINIIRIHSLQWLLLVGKSVPASFEDAQATLQQSSQIYEKEKEASKFILLHRESIKQRQDVAPLFIGDHLAHDSWPVLGMKHCVIGMSELDMHTTYDEVFNDSPPFSAIFVHLCSICVDFQSG